MLKEMLMENRSVRRFDGSDVSEETLRNLVELVRYVPAGQNKQMLCYRLVTDAQEKEAVFKTLGWAGYLTDWDGPEEGQRPGGYLIMLRDKALGQNAGVDPGIQSLAITLGAREAGYGACILLNIKRKELIKALHIDEEHYALEMVIAIGGVGETIKIVDAEDDIRYYRDEQDVHCVPKRTLDALIVPKEV